MIHVFQVVNKLFVLSFEKDADRITHRKYFLAKVELKDCNIKIDGRNFFDRPINNDIETYKNIRKSATGQGDYYKAGFYYINLILKKIIRWLKEI